MKKSRWVGARMSGNLRANIWRQMAQQAREVAERLTDEELRIQMLLIAARYLLLAKRAEREEVRTSHDKSDDEGRG